MADNGSILVTGAAGQLGAVGRTVTGLLLDRGLPVRAMVRREDDRAAASRAAGAEVVVGDLLEPADVYRGVGGCRRGYFGMSGSAAYPVAAVTIVAGARGIRGVALGQRCPEAGPHAEAKEIIASFTIIQADDYDAAVAIARECPPGHAIEIRELAGYA